MRRCRWCRRQVEKFPAKRVHLTFIWESRSYRALRQTLYWIRVSKCVLCMTFCRWCRLELEKSPAKRVHLSFGAAHDALQMVSPTDPSYIPFDLQNSPIFPQESPIFPQKNPIFPFRDGFGNGSEYGNVCCVWGVADGVTDRFKKNRQKNVHLTFHCKFYKALCLAFVSSKRALKYCKRAPRTHTCCRNGCSALADSFAGRYSFSTQPYISACQQHHLQFVLFICVTWLIHMCDMTHSYVWHDSFIRLVSDIICSLWVRGALLQEYGACLRKYKM